MCQQFQHQIMSSGTIDIDEFEDADPDKFEERNDTERIVLFLDEHDNRAWKAATIAERLGLETDAVSAILSRLKERGLVRHKRPYWAITDDDERLQSAYRLHRHHETADEQYGEERLEELQTDEMEQIQ
ncbi:MarR family protein [Halopenitus malekzadehii]|uniref:MarR family protein n=2 Tax=Halopenitus malekzadehii TaxID=1267564 RepID=A0A1H6JLF6_9EURY|nr:MarR family protein [Halopenitus malekzadehii]